MLSPDGHRVVFSLTAPRAGDEEPGRDRSSGTSYGGYFAAWAGTRHSDRFAAAITFSGLSNWISFFGTTDIPYEMADVYWDLWWFDNPGQDWDRSPVAWLDHADTPILVAHGLADERVHPEQAHRIDFMQRAVEWVEALDGGGGERKIVRPVPLDCRNPEASSAPGGRKFTPRIVTPVPAGGRVPNTRVVRKHL